MNVKFDLATADIETVIDILRFHGDPDSEQACTAVADWLEQHLERRSDLQLEAEDNDNEKREQS